MSFPSSHLHSLQVEDCNSILRLVVNEDDNDKYRHERVKHIMGIKNETMPTSQVKFNKHKHKNTMQALKYPSAHAVTLYMPCFKAIN